MFTISVVFKTKIIDKGLKFFESFKLYKQLLLLIFFTFCMFNRIWLLTFSYLTKSFKFYFKHQLKVNNTKTLVKLIKLI